MTDIGIVEGQKYEGIYTTMSKEGVKNAAPIGIVCKGKDKLGCRLFVGTQTLKNIMETRKYVVNITFDPINFVNSTIGNLEIDEFMQKHISFVRSQTLEKWIRLKTM